MALSAKEQFTNVEQIHNYINNDYNTYLENIKANSYNTFKSYRGDLKQFFQAVFNKEPQHVTIEDMASVTGNDIITYRNLLRETYKSNSTINRKINATKSFFSYMETDNPEIRSAVFNKTKRLSEDNKRGWGILTFEEVMEMIELSKELDDFEQMSTLIELGFKSGIRLNALLELTPNDIYKRNQHGRDIYTVEVMDKGSMHIKAISDSLKARMDTLIYTDSLDEKYFKSLHEHKVGNIIHGLCEQMNIDPRRNIRFHSLKKAGINYVYDSTGDIMMAQKQGNHKSASTTMESYMKHKEDLTAMPSYTMGETINIDALKELDKDQLIKVIESASATCQLELLRKLSK